MDADFGKWLGTLGVGGAIAGVVMYFYHRLAESHAHTYADLTERWEKMTDDLRLVVRENTQAFVQALQMIQAMQKQIDRWDGIDRRERRPRAGGAA
jgi:hypothetical protein